MEQDTVCPLCGHTRSGRGYYWVETTAEVQHWSPGLPTYNKRERRRLDPCLACLVGKGHLEGSTVGLAEIDGRIANLSRYRLTVEVYAEMLIKQDGRCKACRTLPEGQALAVDHNHDCCQAYASQKVTCGKCNRGLLCKRCNTGIGYFLDDPGRLLAAARYLAAWQSRSQEGL